MTLRLSYDSSGLIEVEATTKNDKGGLVIKQNAPGLTDAEIAKRLKAMEKLKQHPRDAEENIALLARIRRLYEMASGDDRTMLSQLMIRFEAILADQNPQEIERTRGEISRQLDAIDDYYVS
jgi:molecular chaperone HscC